MIDALRCRAQARATARTAAPATTFTLLDHPVHDGRDEARDRFVALAVRHRARNNLRADHQAQVRSLLGAIADIGGRGAAGHTAHHRLGEAPPAPQPGASRPEGHRHAAVLSGLNEVFG